MCVSAFHAAAAAVYLILALASGNPAHAWIAQKAAGGGASTSLVLFGGSSSTASNSVANFIPLGFGALTAASAGTFTVMPVAGNLASMRARVAATAPTGAQTWTITILKNGSDTGLECVIGSGSAGKCNVTASVAVAAGDYFSVRIRPTNTPTNSRIQVSAVFAPTVANDTVLLGHAVSFSNSATQVQAVGTNYAVGASRRRSIVPDGGTVDKLYVVSNAPGAGASGKAYTYTFLNKNVGTTATCQVFETATTCNDTTHSFSVTGQSGGTPSTTIADDLSVSAAPTSTPTTAVTGFGARFVPTTAGRFPVIGSYNTGFSGTSTFYYQLTGGEGVGTSTEINNQSLGISMTAEKMSVKLTSAPGVGKSLTVTLRVNGSDTALSCTVADTNTGCDVSGSVSVADDDLVGFSSTPSGTPTVSELGVSILASR
jgi:hypothetical protein